MNKLINWMNDFFGDRPSLLPLLGIGLVIVDLILQFIPAIREGWFVSGNVLMHLGIILGIFGVLLAKALEG